MCFFAIFLTVTVPKKVTPQKPGLARTIVVQAEPTHFLEGDLPFHGTPIADRPTEDELPKLAVPAKPEPLEAAGTVSQIKAEPPPPPPEPAPQPLVALDTTGITPPPGILAPLQAKGTAEVEQKGDRLTTVNMSSATFFPSGSATISADGQGVLADVAQRLKSDE